MESWIYPVSEQLFTDSWARELAEKNTDKPKAFDTMFRYSDAMNCSRRLVFDALGVKKSDPIDPAGLHVTTLGTYIHERVQECIERRYPGAKAEIKSSLELTSGSADEVVGSSVITAVIPWEGGDCLYELKSIGGFGFDKAVGLNRKGYKLGSPEGPRISAIVQGGLNALANGCETLVVGYIAMEAVSKGLAEKVGFGEYDRFTAEWHIPREVWEPLALAEQARLERLADYVAARELPPGDAYEKGSWIDISPLDVRPFWSCQYCPHMTTCKASLDGVAVL